MVLRVMEAVLMEKLDSVSSSFWEKVSCDATNQCMTDDHETIQIDHYRITRGLYIDTLVYTFPPDNIISTTDCDIPTDISLWGVCGCKRAT